MEIDSESKKRIDNDDDEEERLAQRNLLETCYVDINDFESQDVDYLLYAETGNASAFLKASLYEEIKRNGKALKGKFMQFKPEEKNKPKKLVAELYQFKTESSYNLVLLAKENLNIQNFKTISEHLVSNGVFKIKRFVLFASRYHKDLLTTQDLSNKLFCIKNSIQLQVNQLIKAEPLPVMNSIRGFPAYMLKKCEILGFPCVIYLASYENLQVGKENLAIFSDTSVTYPFFRNKLDEEYLKSKGIKLQEILSEFNSHKLGLYS